MATRYDTLFRSIVHDIDTLMDLLKQQLNKNPKSRFSRPDEEEEKSSHKHNNRVSGANKKNKRKKQDSNVFMSRRLSYYLRHGAEKARLKMRNDGYVLIDEILRLKEFKECNATFAGVKHIVDTNDKQRFSMMQESDRWYIRANQGHSLKSVESEQLLQPIQIGDAAQFPVVCHGTYLKAWEIIRTEGLSRMTRNHIHFVASDSFKGKGVISGMRGNCQVLVYLELAAAIQDGIHFFVSDNNVILSPGDANGKISPTYFQKVTTFEKGQPGEILWQKHDRDIKHQKESAK